MTNTVLGWFDDTGKFGTWGCNLCGATGNGRRAAFNRHYLAHHTTPQEPGA